MERLIFTIYKIKDVKITNWSQIYIFCYVLTSSGKYANAFALKDPM